MAPISSSDDFYLKSYEGFSVFVGVVIFAAVVCCPTLFFEDHEFYIQPWLDVRHCASIGILWYAQMCATFLYTRTQP